jgi:hypothetical protein
MPRQSVCAGADSTSLAFKVSAEALAGSVAAGRGRVVLRVGASYLLASPPIGSTRDAVRLLRRELAAMGWKGNAVFVAVVCMATVQAAVADDDASPAVIFKPKVFYDSVDIVHVEGTLVGEGIAHKNNRSVITCYRVRRECLTVHIEADGAQVSSVGVPTSFTVDFWASDRILADLAVLCPDLSYARLDKEWRAMALATWVIDRTRKTAELIDHSCLEAKTQHWTVEDPPFWRDTKKPADAPELQP